MGLDVYLYHCDQRPLATQLEREYEEQSERIWKEICGDKKFDDIPEAERKKAQKIKDEFRQKMGLEEYGRHPSRQQIEENSKLHPEHMFKVGYFRSSYNSGGINSVLQRLNIPELYEIFDKQEDEHDFTPDWALSLKRAKATLKKLQKFVASDKAKFDSMEIYNYGDDKDKPNDSGQALKVFYKQLESGSKLEGGYSSKEGTFYLNCDPLKVRAVIPGGKAKYGIGGNPTFVIYEVDPKATYQYYIEALEVVVETIEYVLAQKDPENYYFGWSG